MRCWCVYMFACGLIKCCIGPGALLASGCICLKFLWAWGGGVQLSMYEHVRQHGQDSVSEGILTAVTIHAPLQLLQQDPEEHLHSSCLPLACSFLFCLVPLRLLPATRGQCVYPATHYSPINPIIRLFFQGSPGQSLCWCRLSSMGGWQRRISGEQLSTAA